MIDQQQIGEATITRTDDGLVWSLRGGPYVRVSFCFQAWFERDCPWDWVHVETDIFSETVVYLITNTRPLDRW